MLQFILKFKLIHKDLKISSSKKSLVTIIIPTYDQTLRLYKCLKSIFDIKLNFKIEIIVIDDYENRKIKPWFIDNKIKYIKNKKNLGFIGSCNLGASKAKGKYLFFLNDDTVLKDSSSVKALIEVFNENNNVGLVGSKVLIRDKALQEAGCITFKDGRCYQFGKYQNPRQDLYNYLTEVDYVSGCSLMIPKNYFKNIRQKIFASILRRCRFSS